MVRDLLRDEVSALPECNRRKLQFLIDRPASSVTLPRNESVVEEVIGYDKTGDSLERSKESTVYRSKRSQSGSVVLSAPVEEGMRKRLREEEPTPNPTVVPATNYNFGETRMVTQHRSLNWSFSEPQLVVLSPATALTLGRRHTFLQKTAFKAQYCDHCDRRFAFASVMWRCEVCKLQCHSECRNFALLPCIARGTPMARNQRGMLADYVPKEAPMVPNVVVHCVNEIERRGVTGVGFYRVPGSEAEVNEVLDRFLYGRGVPNLRLILDTNVLACCLKKFLQQLREPLVPPSSWHEFVKAPGMARGEAVQVVHQAVVELPRPNRDTLAFVVGHLQRVAQYSNENKMPISNLAKVFGPTIVGYSSSSVVDLKQGMDETPKQEAVMKLLMELDAEYWARFLEEGGMLMERQGISTPNTVVFGTPKSSYKRGQKRYFNPPWK